MRFQRLFKNATTTRVRQTDSASDGEYEREPTFWEMPRSTALAPVTMAPRAMRDSAERGGHASDRLSSPMRLPIQRMPKVHAEGDRYEIEAEEIADKVMQMAAPAASTEGWPAPRHNAAPLPSIQRLGSGSSEGSFETSGEVAARLMAQESSGSPLSSSDKAFF